MAKNFFDVQVKNKEEAYEKNMSVSKNNDYVIGNLTFTLLYSTIYINYRTFVVPIANSSIVYFDCSRIVYRQIFAPASPPTTA